jgi:hypothetical protein
VGALLRSSAAGCDALDSQCVHGCGRGFAWPAVLVSVDADGSLFAPGALYVLPAAGFAHESRLAGLFDTAHRTRVGAVRALGWFEVEPGAFPFLARTTKHTNTDTIARTIWTAGWGHGRWLRSAQARGHADAED